MWSFMIDYSTQKPHQPHGTKSLDRHQTEKPDKECHRAYYATELKYCIQIIVKDGATLVHTHLKHKSL